MFEQRHGHGWQWLTDDRIVNEGETLLHKLVMTCSSSGGRVLLYEGLDAQSGRLIGSFKGLENQPSVIDFGGIFLDRGLFVDLESHMEGCLVIYDTLREVNPNIED